MIENNRCQSLDFTSLYKVFEHIRPYQRIGKIISSQGSVFKVSLAQAKMGASVEFITPSGQKSMGEVIGISGNQCLAVPYSEIDGINSDTLVCLRDQVLDAKMSKNLLGRVIDFQGNPIDKKGPIEGPFESRSIIGESINPLERPPIRGPLDTGINAINCFLTAGKGQRFAIMAGSGVGKSVLLGMIAQNYNGRY